LFEVGLRGVDNNRGVANNAIWEDFSARHLDARLWPQTEYLKASLALGDTAGALAACNGLASYLATPLRGTWRDTMNTDGGFVDEAAPASSFYHILLAILEMLPMGAA
jgi:mannose-6-phosphate isomerase